MDRLAVDLGKMNTSVDGDEIRHWHVCLREDGNKMVLVLPPGEEDVDVSDCLLNEWFPQYDLWRGAKCLNLIEEMMTESFKTDPEMQAGTLSDKQIENACNDKWLISENFDAQRIRQSCYELRAGHIYYELDRTDSNTTPKRHELTKDEFILLKPKQLITIITLESLRLPQNALGRVLTKGQLFSLGIIPVNTYADPGFEGNVGITFANFSNNYIKISQGQAIAKIEFSKLRSPVESPYQGQHGYQTEMWPIPHQMILSRDELSGDPRLPHPTEELELTHGKAIAEISKRMFRYERYLIVASIVYFLFTMLLIAWIVSQNETKSFSALVGVGIGVVSNIVFGLLTLAATRLSK